MVHPYTFLRLPSGVSPVGYRGRMHGSDENFWGFAYGSTIRWIRRGVLAYVLYSLGLVTWCWHLLFPVPSASISSRGAHNLLQRKFQELSQALQEDPLKDPSNQSIQESLESRDDRSKTRQRNSIHLRLHAHIHVTPWITQLENKPIRQPASNSN